MNWELVENPGLVTLFRQVDLNIIVDGGEG